MKNKMKRTYRWMACSLLLLLLLLLALRWGTERSAPAIPETSAAPAESAPPPTEAPEPAIEETESEERILTVSILGDSYSAFKGFTEPASNVAYYPISDPETEGRGNDVEHAEEMWWYLFAEENGVSILQNDSYSGSPVSYDGYAAGRADARDYSFVRRCTSLRPADLIIIEGGTNDSHAGTAVGEYQYADWEEADFQTFRPALAYVLDTVCRANPSATVVFMLNEGLRSDISESVETVCAHYSVSVLHLSGISRQNMHPSVEGMRQISDQLTDHLRLLAEQD